MHLYIFTLTNPRLTSIAERDWERVRLTIHPLSTHITTAPTPTAGLLRPPHAVVVSSSSSSSSYRHTSMSYAHALWSHPRIRHTTVTHPRILHSHTHTHTRMLPPTMKPRSSPSHSHPRPAPPTHPIHITVIESGQRATNSSSLSSGIGRPPPEATIDWLPAHIVTQPTPNTKLLRLSHI